MRVEKQAYVFIWANILFTFLPNCLQQCDKNSAHIRPAQLLNATCKDVDIYDHQVLKYQPLMTSGLIFQYLMINYRIKC